MNFRSPSLAFLVLIVLEGIAYSLPAKAFQTTPASRPQTRPQSPADSTKATLTKVIRFSGEVANGQRFEKDLGDYNVSHDIAGYLVFRLEPHDASWTISIGTRFSRMGVRNDSSVIYNNFAAVVTPAYRGVNDIYIEGWHFRNSDNTGPNEVGAKNVNAP